MLIDDLEVGIGEDLAGAVVAARAKIEFCVLQCDIRGNDSFQSLDAFGDDFLPDAVTGNYCEFQICHAAIVARGRRVGRRCPYFGERGRPQGQARRRAAAAPVRTTAAYANPRAKPSHGPRAQPLAPRYRHQLAALTLLGGIA